MGVSCSPKAPFPAPAHIKITGNINTKYPEITKTFEQSRRGYQLRSARCPKRTALLKRRQHVQYSLVVKTEPGARPLSDSFG